MTSSSAPVDDPLRDADSYFTSLEPMAYSAKQKIAEETAAENAKTARLRALRLAKEAAENGATL